MCWTESYCWTYFAIPSHCHGLRYFCQGQRCQRSFFFFFYAAGVRCQIHFGHFLFFSHCNIVHSFHSLFSLLSAVKSSISFTNVSSVTIFSSNKGVISEPFQGLAHTLPHCLPDFHLITLLHFLSNTNWTFTQSVGGEKYRQNNKLSVCFQVLTRQDRRKKRKKLNAGAGLHSDMWKEAWVICLAVAHWLVMPDVAAQLPKC